MRHRQCRFHRFRFRRLPCRPHPHQQHYRQRQHLRRHSPLPPKRFRPHHYRQQQAPNPRAQPHRPWRHQRWRSSPKCQSRSHPQRPGPGWYRPHHRCRRGRSDHRPSTPRKRRSPKEIAKPEACARPIQGRKFRFLVTGVRQSTPPARVVVCRRHSVGKSLQPSVDYARRRWNLPLF